MLVIARTAAIAKNIICDVTHQRIQVQEKIDNQAIFDFQTVKAGCTSMLFLFPDLDK